MGKNEMKGSISAFKIFSCNTWGKLDRDNPQKLCLRFVILSIEIECMGLYQP